MEATNKTNRKIQNRNLGFSSWLLSLGLLLTGLGGSFAPWIWRDRVALQLTGPGLAEFVKFLPEIRSGQIVIERLYFLMPLGLAMLALPLFACNPKLRLPNWYRWALRLVVVPLALASLSPVWTPAILTAPEFRLQTTLAVTAMGLTMIAPLFKSLSLKLLVILSGAGAILALILPGWQFGLVQASMIDVYHEPVSLGWGWWLTVTGLFFTISGGVWAAFLPDNGAVEPGRSTKSFNHQATLRQNRPNLGFRPHRLARNPHLQTMASSLFSSKGARLLAASQEMILDAGQGVRLQGFYAAQASDQSKGLVLILSGWLGHASSTYIIAIGEYLYNRGYSIFRLNFRDHGDTYHLNPGMFRGDLLDEAFGATQRIAELANHRPVHIIGTSMGGSFALRLAWRHAQRPLSNLGHTIAINPSVNPYHTVLALDTGLPLYLAYFRRKWRNAFKNKKVAFPDRYDITAVLAASTCMAMTEAFIPFSPYPNAMAYLDSYAVRPEMMATLKSPVTILTAADDPIVPVTDIYPFQDISPHLEISIQPYGGHIGFIDIFPFRRWINEAIGTILETSPSLHPSPSPKV